MINTGNVSQFDDLGRIHIPKTLRELVFRTTETAGMRMEIFYEKDGTIILKPYDYKYKEEL